MSKRGIQIYPEGVEPRLCHSIAALPAHAAVPRTYQLDIDNINKGGPTHGENRSISNPQHVLPLPEFALEAHAFSDLPLDLLAGLCGGFARSPILPAGLIKVGNKSVALTGAD